MDKFPKLSKKTIIWQLSAFIISMLMIVILCLTIVNTHYKQSNLKKEYIDAKNSAIHIKKIIETDITDEQLTRIILQNQNFNEFERYHSITLVVVILAFLSIVVFIINRLQILTVIRKKLEEKTPHAIKSKEEESIISNVTKIINYNEKIEGELSRLKADFEIKLDEKTSNLKKEIKERKKAEIQIENSLNEKVVLLKEIHHRVKNNLAIVTGLIRMQARQIDNIEVKDVFSNLQNRIKTMELIHTNLYRSKDLSKIDFNSYIISLVRNIKSTFDDKENILFRVHCENIELTIEEATACGQIINELVTNSFKHAFDENSEGEIKIELVENNGICILNVSDNGKGINENSKKKRTNSRQYFSK